MGKKDKKGAQARPFAQLRQLVLTPTAKKPVAPQKAVAPLAPVQLDDASLFAAAMQGTERIGEAIGRVLQAPKVATPLQPDEDALALAELAALCDGEVPFRAHESEEVFYGCAPGVNHVLLDGLRRGQYAYQACLDLHGMTRDEAHRAVARFVAQARCHDGACCVLIITGRGRKSPGGLSVLRETLPRWLSRAPVRPHVLAYATARPVDGGPGAFYVLLRRQGIAPFGVA